jgi:DNA-binding protein HU-beta
MNRTDVANAVADTMGISKIQASELTKLVFNTVKESIIAGDQVAIADFGVFKIKEKAERTGRNPKTGEALVIPAKSVVKFSASKDFRDAM